MSEGFSIYQTNHLHAFSSSDYMNKMKIPNGLLELGYNKDDIPNLVKGAIPQVTAIFKRFLVICFSYLDNFHNIFVDFINKFFISK